MHIPDGRTDWQQLYKDDIAAAEEAFRANSFEIDPLSVVGDIYALPTQNHQAFYGKLIKERGFYKIICAKPIQNSVWFSEQIYMYAISEARRFENHPTRNGRIICRAELIDKRIIQAISGVLELLMYDQPKTAVIPSPEAVLTGIRLFENGVLTRKLFYTDASRLRFINGENPEAINYLNNLYLIVEKIIGVGE